MTDLRVRYARKLARGPSVADQLAAMGEAPGAASDLRRRVFVDDDGGTTALDDALQTLRPGDALEVASLDVLGSTGKQLLDAVAAAILAGHVIRTADGTEIGPNTPSSVSIPALKEAGDMQGQRRAAPATKARRAKRGAPKQMTPDQISALYDRFLAENGRREKAKRPVMGIKAFVDQEKPVGAYGGVVSSQTVWRYFRDEAKRREQLRRIT